MCWALGELLVRLLGIGAVLTIEREIWLAMAVSMVRTLLQGSLPWLLPFQAIAHCTRWTGIIIQHSSINVSLPELLQSYTQQ